MRGNPDPARLAGALLKQAGKKPEGDLITSFEEVFGMAMGAPQMVIMPTFNDLMGGLPVNEEAPKSLLGPLFRSGAVDVEDFDVYLLDGSFLGKVSFLRALVSDPASMD